MKFLKTHKLTILLLILLSLPALLPLFRDGFFQSDDGEWMIIRFSAFHQALVDGQFPVRFLHRLNYGYGYPVANFLYPGFMYLGEPLRLLGFGFVEIIKITIGICLLVSALFSYFWLGRVFGKWSAFFGALAYVYVPYHLFDVYKRGSVGEVLALALLPFIFWQMERKSVFWTSLGVAFLILSHNTLAFLFLPVCIGYVLLKKQKSFFSSISPFLFGIGLSSFFWFPALYDLQYTVFNKTKVSEWGQYFPDISLIGISSLFVIVASGILVIKKRDISKSLFPIYFLCIAIASVFFATSLSNILWEILPVSFVQFPFRFLAITVIAVSFLTAFLLEHVSKKVRLGLGIFLLILFAISANPYLKPESYFNKDEMLYVTNEATTTVQDEYMPKWVLEKPSEHFKSKVEIKSGEGEVSSTSYDGKRIVTTVDAKTNVVLTIHAIYFPGWKAYVDKQEVAISYANKKGLIELAVPPGKHVVEVMFGETPQRLASDVISVGFGIALLSFVSKKKQE